MVSRHKYFVSQLGTCTISNILEIDRKIPPTQTTIRKLILNIRDQQDNHRIFNSINLKWNTSNTWNITYRPDKRTLAYQYCNSLCTYVQHLHPDKDLSHIFTLDAIDEAAEEIYHPETQTLTTIEDLAIQAELDQDADGDSMNFVDMSGLTPPEPKQATAPVEEIRNARLFNLSGDADTVSTMANDALSVTFADHDVDKQSVTSSVSHTSQKTHTSSTSRITRAEEASTKMSNDVAAMRNELS